VYKGWKRVDRRKSVVWRSGWWRDEAISQYSRST
jgi:hypothetical protein